MSKVVSSTVLPVPAQSVWAVIGGFNTLSDWHPAVEKSETKDQDGTKVRTLTLAGGGAIVEKLVSSDDKERTYNYTIVSGPLPVTNYEASIKVRENEGGFGCTVEWASEFDASGAPEDDAVAAIRGIYEAGFENLKKMFGA
jgi:hypothetical protein